LSNKNASFLLQHSSFFKAFNQKLIHKTAENAKMLSCFQVFGQQK